MDVHHQVFVFCVREMCALAAILWYGFLEWVRRISVPFAQTILCEESKWNIH